MSTRQLAVPTTLAVKQILVIADAERKKICQSWSWSVKAPNRDFGDFGELEVEVGVVRS
jgi:hypothetical protein